MNEEQPPLNFLIVDDDIPLSLFFKETLQHAGHRVLVAVNEHGALEIIRQEPIHIMICDYMLPGIDGNGIVDAVKQYNKAVFCVLISGHPNHLHNNRHLFVNADMVIAKPVLKETLQRIVHQYHLTTTVQRQNI